MLHTARQHRCSTLRRIPLIWQLQEAINQRVNELDDSDDDFLETPHSFACEAGAASRRGWSEGEAAEPAPYFAPHALFYPSETPAMVPAAIALAVGVVHEGLSHPEVVVAAARADGERDDAAMGHEAAWAARVLEQDAVGERATDGHDGEAHIDEPQDPAQASDQSRNQGHDQDHGLGHDQGFASKVRDGEAHSGELSSGERAEGDGKAEESEYLPSRSAKRRIQRVRCCRHRHCCYY